MNSIQDKFVKNTLYVVLGIILIGFIAIQPYNLYCRIKKTCNQVTIASFKTGKLAPKESVGVRELNIKFISNIPKELEGKVRFNPEHDELLSLTGKHLFNSYHIQNLTNKSITATAQFRASPKGVEQYLERIQCPCMGLQNIDAKETGSMPIELRINPKIESDLRFIKLKEVVIEYTITLK